MGELTQHFLKVVHLHWLVNYELVQALGGVYDRALLPANGGRDRQRIAQVRGAIDLGDGANGLEESNILIEEVRVSWISSSGVVPESRSRRKGRQRDCVAFTEALEDGLGCLKHVLPERVELGLRDAARHIGLGEVRGGQRLLDVWALEISKVNTLKE